METHILDALLTGLIDTGRPIVLLVLAMGGLGVWVNRHKNWLTDAINAARADIAEHDKRQQAAQESAIERHEALTAHVIRVEGKLDSISERVVDLSVRVGEHAGALARINGK